MPDIGKYNADPARYQELVDELYRDHPSIMLGSEYSSFIENDLLRLLIRLARYKFVARMIKPTDAILEVGCGSGLGSIFLAQHCAHVTGLEPKASEIEEARAINRRKNVAFDVADVMELAPEPRYDVLVALDVIEHMPEEDGHRLVQAMARFLKPNGMIVIGSPSLYSYPYQSALSQASHIKCYDQKELTDLMDRSFGRTLAFSMNDEVVHTGHSKMAWYYFVLGFLPFFSGANSARPGQAE